jgi:hypothetical protein
MLQSRIASLSWALTILVSSFPCSAADWTTYLNGNNRAGFTSATLDPSLRLAWVYHSQAKPEMAWSAPRSTPIEGHVMRHRVDFDSSIQVVLDEQRAYFGSKPVGRYGVSTRTDLFAWPQRSRMKMSILGLMMGKSIVCGLRTVKWCGKCGSRRKTIGCCREGK